MKQHLSALTALVLVATTAQPVLALSCLRPDVAEAFKTVSESDKQYYILHGSFGFDPAVLPVKDATPEAIQFEAKFTGKLMTGEGFTDELSTQAQISLLCAGPWCARIEPHQEFIAFVEQDEDNNSLLFAVGPCYNLAFADPSEDDIKRLETCAAGGACEALQ